MYYISVGGNWYPPELTAYDEQDGPVNVTYTGEYNVNVIGVYTITYMAVDSDGNITIYRIYLHVIDDVNGQPPSNYPEMDEDALSSIKNQFQSDRSKLNPKYDLSSFHLDLYYSTLQNLSGEAFVSELCRILSSNITLVSYDDARFVLEKSDAIDSPWGTYIYGIYDGKKHIRYWDSGSTWNREHVWPQSKLEGASESDVHNLRASTARVNSSRGNVAFVEGAGSYKRIGTGWYPGDEHKGDVARIAFYMYARWGLEITSNGIGDLMMFIRWHQEDPVDEFEIHRNNVIYSYQGNRNPFIDRPEYVYMIFDVEMPNYQESFIVTVKIPIQKIELDLNELQRRTYI